MIVISIQDAVKTLRSANEELSERNFGIAVSRTLNESILQGRTQARAAVKEKYNIPQRYLAGINVNKANPSNLTASVYASATPVPMDAFAPKFQTTTRSLTISRRGEQKQRTFKKAKSNPAGGVSIEVIKGQRETVPYAFMIPNAKPRVFARGAYKDGTSYGFVQRNKRENKKGSDTPIKPLLSITTHAAVINPDSLQKVESKVNSVYLVSLQRNINNIIERVRT